MSRKILCWLGFHKWVNKCMNGKCIITMGIHGDCINCPASIKECFVCKHCGKVKR